MPPLVAIRFIGNRRSRKQVDAVTTNAEKLFRPAWSSYILPANLRKYPKMSILYETISLIIIENSSTTKIERSHDELRKGQLL